VADRRPALLVLGLFVPALSTLTAVYGLRLLDRVLGKLP
jgi:hypothetical protein